MNGKEHMDNAERRNYIGGSDIAAVMGLSRWKTPLKLWAEKVGKIEPKDLSDLEHVEIGSDLEEYVAKRFQKKTGYKVRRDTRMFTHSQFPYMVAHIDRRIEGEDAILECKTTSAWNAKEWEGEDIPQEYIFQVMWYLGIVGKSKGYIAVLIGGQKFVWKEIVFVPEMFDRMVDAAELFWEEFVKKEVAPVAIAGDSETLLELYPEGSDTVLEFQGEEEEQVNALIQERLGGLEAIDSAKEEVSKIEAQIKQKLGEASCGVTGQYKITWNNVTRTDPDRDKMKADGIWDNYIKQSSFRQFRTTGRKEKKA